MKIIVKIYERMKNVGRVDIEDYACEQILQNVSEVENA